jgi:signal transduction histidine kinase
MTKESYESLLKENQELKAALEQLKASQEAHIAEACRARTEKVASLVAHELRNPLSAILNIAFFLKRQIQSDNPQVSEFINILFQSVESANTIVSDLLYYSRVRNLVRAPVALSSLLNRTVLEYSALPEITITTIPPDNDSTIDVDQDRMVKALGNLIKNAIHAQQGKGEIILSATIDGTMANIIVRDTGCGIAPENLSRIFDPFFTTWTGTLGLGLAVTKDIIEKHAGTIAVDSQLNNGTTVSIKLPLANFR